MRKILLCSAALLAWGCKDGGGDASVAASISLAPASVTMDAVGATRVVRATVVDREGRTIRSPGLTWRSSSAAVTVAGAGGDSAIVTSAGNGPATVTASSGSVSASVLVEVAQTASGLQKSGGDAQTGVAGVALPNPLRVGVRDRMGAPVAGVAVSFLVVGGGTLSPASAVSGADGNVAFTWTLGPVAGTSQQVIVSAAGVPEVQFTAASVHGPPAASSPAAGDNQVAPRGGAVGVAPRVQVRDAFGNPVAGATVQFAVTSGGGSVTGALQPTDASGLAAVGSWTLGGVAGTNTLTATFPGTTAPPVVFTAIGSDPGTVSISGQNQAAMAGSAIPVNPSVVIRDANGDPVAGLTVTFTVTSGGGSVGNATAVTSAAGVASPGAWRLGTVPGVNTIAVSVSGLYTPPATIRAAGCTGGGGTGYALTLCFISPMTAQQRGVFETAAARWASVITGDLEDIDTPIPGGTCFVGQPGINMVMDDLVIFAAIDNIDGPGAILGQAGWCFRRLEGLPVVGLMFFDAADVAMLQGIGQLENVILHEMGHVLGIGGSLWAEFGLLQNASTNRVIQDTYFSGANAIAAFNAIGGASYVAGQKVPVENTGGSGTANAHWRESVLYNELMTGYLDGGMPNPLSQLTVRSLIDLGYQVNVAQADPFSLIPALRADAQPPGPRLRLHDDAWAGPRFSIGRQGRINRIR